MNQLAHSTPQTRSRVLSLTLTLVLAAFLTPLSTHGSQSPMAPLSPTALVGSPNGQMLYVGCATAPSILGVDIASQKITSKLDLDRPASGLTIDATGKKLYVTCPGPSSTVEVVDLDQGRVVQSLTAGHTATAPVLSPDGKTLFVCLRFQNQVTFLDLASGQTIARVAVEREPVAADITPNGKYLLVANQLHTSRADRGHIAAAVTVINVSDQKVEKTLRLPNGSGYLNDVAISPDGRYACVTHILSRYPLPTTQLERGWMNTNAKTLIDLATLEILNTVLLDNVDRGAANPWGAAWSTDSKQLVIAHAGTHEVSVIDFPPLETKLKALPDQAPLDGPIDYATVSKEKADVPNDLAFLVGLRKRVRLPEHNLGPRAVTVVGDLAYVANYFSDTLSLISLSSPVRAVDSIQLGPKTEMTHERLGELYFHDARICFQEWQSCASCHPGEARMDALNWDLLNDGIGNPKNNRSLLYSHRMGPAMSMGVRPSAEEAVRAGIEHILFTVQPEEVPEAMDAYLKSLAPVPSPYLENGNLSAAANRGKQTFENEIVGCAVCHPGELYSDMKAHDVGSQGALDHSEDTFYTPTLVEIWRTAPYLHDGSAATLSHIFSRRNPDDRHGKTSHLSPDQLDDLVAYLRSL